MSQNTAPSKETEVPWIHACNENIGKEATENIGKWLVFVPLNELDSIWQKIKTATEQGELWRQSKTATAQKNSLAPNQNIKVICVYTYDSEDKEDVARIAWKLHQIGALKGSVLNYKKDIATVSGEYAVEGNTKISRYSLSSWHLKKKVDGEWTPKTLSEFIEFFNQRF